MRHSGFTMIELLLAVSLMTVIVVVGFMSFTTVNRIWRLGTEAADSIHHADFVMEQLSMALRSAYYPDAAKPSPAYGMLLVNDGDEEEARDSLTWVKLGGALVGKDWKDAEAPHKITVTAIGEGESEEPGFEAGGLVIRAWRMSALPEDFDPEDEEFEEYVKPHLVTPDVIAIDLKMLDPEGNLAEGREMPEFDEEEELEWIDEDWKDDYTNRLPYAVEATLYMRAPEEGGEPIAIKRIVTIPAAPLAWRDKGAAGGKTETGGSSKKKNTDRNGKRNGSNGGRGNNNGGNGGRGNNNGGNGSGGGRGERQNGGAHGNSRGGGGQL